MWRVYARDVNGNDTGTITTAMTRWGAEYAKRRYLRVGRAMFGTPSGVLEPRPGRPLYTVHVERG